MNGWRAPVVLAALVAALVLVVSGSGLGERFELPLRDRLMRLSAGEPAASVAVVAIDDASLAALGAWPWPRRLVAEVVDATFARGAVGVAVDVLMVEPTPDDAILGEALRAGDTMLLAGFGPEGGLLPAPAPLAGGPEPVHGVLELDGDGVLRRLSPTKQTKSASYTAMSVAAAARVRRGMAIPIGRQLVPAFSVRPDDVPLVRASDLVAGDGGGILSGRVAMVGVTATGLGDRVITPVTREGWLDPGVVVHATVAEAIIRGDLVTLVPPWITALVAGGLSLAAWGASRLGGRIHVAGVILVIAVPILGGAALFLSLDIALPMSLLTMAAVGSVLVVESRTLLSVERGLGRTSRVLGAAAGEEGSPSDRVRRLEELAGEIARERRQTSESQRVVAHELRTPLTSIRGLAQLLSAYELSEEERRRVAGMVAEESTRLHEMVEGLLDLERLALRDRRGASRWFDAGEILVRRAELARAAGRQSIDLTCGEALGVDGDPELFERLVENLVGNAMKFSPSGSTVMLRGERRGGEVVIEVEDEGPGIPPEERELVFRRFGRGRGSDEQPGLGLGLAMVAEIARWHGGRAEVDEGPRGGACLRVRLPAAG